MSGSGLGAAFQTEYHGSLSPLVSEMTMRKTRLILACLLAAYLVLGLTFGGLVGYLQPEDDGTAVIRTFDPDGTAHETVVRPVTDEDGQIWILSGQWLRSWYHRAVENPAVELLKNNELKPFRVTVIEDEEQIEKVMTLRRGKASATGVFLYRALFFFAPIKILKLEAS